MKTTILHIILALAIVIATPNAYADGRKAEKEKNTKREKAEKLGKRITSSFDLELKLENWMLDTQEFSNEETIYEKDLMLESWMTEVDVFNPSMDQEMELENWMTGTFEIEELEMDMSLENWMTEPFVSDEKFNEKELVLEDWMLKF